MKIKIEQTDSSNADILGDIETLVYPKGGAWTGEMFFTDMNEKNRLYMVAKDGDKIIGFSSASYFMETADILRVAVLPEYQHQSIATDLMKALLENLKKLQVSKVILEVEDSNKKALGLYIKVGFKKISSRKNYYGNGRDGLIYSLEI